MIRVLIADDQAPARQGVRELLADEPDIEVIGEAEDGHDLVALATRRCPEVVLTDIRMPRMDGLAAIARLVGTVPHLP